MICHRSRLILCFQWLFHNSSVLNRHPRRMHGPQRREGLWMAWPFGRTLVVLVVVSIRPSSMTSAWSISYVELLTLSINEVLLDHFCRAWLVICIQPQILSEIVGRLYNPQIQPPDIIRDLDHLLYDTWKSYQMEIHFAITTWGDVRSLLYVHTGNWQLIDEWNI